MIRDFQENDFNLCTALVNKVWGLDKHFSPAGLAVFVQNLFVGMSAANSNFLKVIEDNNTIVGLIFGKIEKQKCYKNSYSGILGFLKLIKQLFTIKGVSFGEKYNLLKGIISHEKKRKKVESKKSSEVNLFAVHPDSQGKGYGKKLINEFIQTCKQYGVKRLVLETDADCNYGFYENIGFKHIASFESKLLKRFSEKSSETFIYELKF